MSTPTGEVHPVASLFPLMGDEELRGLAEDIRANGQRVPVMIDGEGRLIDGRNRVRACELAGVEPRYESVNGDDPLALSVSLNGKRRDLTSGQRAIAAAEAWDVPSLKIGSGKRSTRLGEMFGVSRAYVEQARALVERAPDLAESVKTGARQLTEAYGILRDRISEEERARAEAVERERERERIRAEHADLFEAIESDRLTVADAMAEVARREGVREADEREKAEAAERLRGYLRTALTHLSWDGDIAARAAWTAEQIGTVDDLTAERFITAARAAQAIADAIKEQSS